jgi:hypothetical protein
MLQVQGHGLASSSEDDDADFSNIPFPQDTAMQQVFNFHTLKFVIGICFAVTFVKISGQFTKLDWKLIFVLATTCICLFLVNNIF